MGEITRAEYDMLMDYVEGPLFWKNTDEQIRLIVAAITRNQLTVGELKALVCGDTSFIAKGDLE